MELCINKTNVLMDEKLDIQMKGFLPSQSVKIEAEVPEFDMISEAEFLVDADGCVDISTQKPVSGDYNWLDSMGLLVTLRGDKSDRIGFSETPHKIIFTAKQGTKQVTKPVCRSWMAEGVIRSDIHEDGLHGVLFMPAGEGPFPAVMVVSGSSGGVNQETAALLANHGYAAFALAYFAYEGCPDYMIEIPLEYFEQGFKWLMKRPGIDKNRLAVLGGSRGGELSLQLGSMFTFIKTVVANVPSSVRWGGLASEDNNPDKPAWTWKGKPLPYMQHFRDLEIDYDEVYGDKPVPLTPEFLHAMKENEMMNEAGIEVEKTRGAILLISGDDDQMWPSSMFSKSIIERLGKHEFSFPYEHIEYSGAGHVIRPAYSVLAPYASMHPVLKKLFAFGGSPKAMAFANEDSWKRTLLFLKKHLD